MDNAWPKRNALMRLIFIVRPLCSPSPARSGLQGGRSLSSVCGGRKNLPSIDLDQDIAAISVGRMRSMLCLFFIFLLHDVFWRREWICRPKAGHGG